MTEANITRISADQGDTGHDAYQRYRASRIHLDGAEVTNVITADAVEGFIVQYARDDAGNPILSSDGASVEKVTRRGVVRIELVAQHKVTQ